MRNDFFIGKIYFEKKKDQLGVLSTNIEIRSTKQIQNLNASMFKTEIIPDKGFGHLNLDF